MPSKYQDLEKTKQTNLITSKSPYFYDAVGGKYFMKKKRDFVLIDGIKNIFAPIQTEVLDYFEKNKISWWGGTQPTGHVLSSQIACLNHLYAIRYDKQAVLTILNNISNNFKDVLQIDTDNPYKAFIQFEAISKDPHLNEDTHTRGTQCTSIDALIYAVHSDGSKWLIPIEWKYTEHYANQNKATEGFKKDPNNYRGKERLDRYESLIQASAQLKPDSNHGYYFEPFYQLMRQTLWAEQMIKHSSTETLQASNYLHVHVIPEDNEALLKKSGKPYKCSGQDMKTTWKSHLRTPDKYQIITPQKLMSGIDSNKYKDLLDYLATRYW